MATTYTTNIRLQKPAAADRHWDIPLNANADSLDGLAAVGGLAVTSAEVPSVSLACQIASGTYLKADGSIFTFPGTSSLLLGGNATSAVWLTDAGVPTSGPSFPSVPHVRLAQVQTGPASILQVIDARVPYQSAGANTVFVAKSGDTVAGPFLVAPPAGGAPVMALDPTNQTVAFFGAPASTQAPRLNALTDSTGGAVGDIVIDAGAAFSQTTLNNNFASLAAKVDALIAALKRHGLMST